MVVQLVLFWSLSQHEQFIRFLQWKNSCWLIRFSRFLFPYIFVSHLFFMKTGASHIDVLFLECEKIQLGDTAGPRQSAGFVTTKSKWTQMWRKTGLMSSDFRGGGPRTSWICSKKLYHYLQSFAPSSLLFGRFRNNPSILGSQNWPHFFLEQCLEVMILFPIANW